ncbi:hypothetical protein BRADI_2g24831v3 [Brachypodium distachyon]|uniref:DUF4283 domain-containing protein n=1 Tax=Brachypodium distachyon TaxID=15368 RepID=A0A0Q3MPL2_BRADI|nr:hypothetical protein BRADI_2g24831v3 [Brachypodium distachyon]
MEGVEKKLVSMRLSDAEKKEAKLGRRNPSQLEFGKLQDVGKLKSDKPRRVDALINTLDRIWCPFKGIDCKELGMNRFRFTFREVAGKRRSLNDGPWMLNKCLLVLVNFNPAKTLDGYEFRLILIWVRVYGILMGGYEYGIN